jgi:hypothetical protein
MREDRSSEDLASAIYGTILSTALIAAYSEDAGNDPLQVAVASATTVIVFWIAHAYSGLIARGGVHADEAISRAREELAHNWPLVLGAIPPILPLLLGAAGVFSTYHAENVAIATGIAVLGLWGMFIAWRRGRGLAGIAFGATGAAFFGFVVVSLKALVH